MQHTFMKNRDAVIELMRSRRVPPGLYGFDKRGGLHILICGNVFTAGVTDIKRITAYVDSLGNDQLDLEDAIAMAEETA